MSYKEWAESQLAEVELLTSMFPGEDELDLTDQLALADLRSYVENSASGDKPSPSRPQFLIKQRLHSSVMNGTEFILSCAYPSEYPSVLPDITVRCSALSRAQQTEIQTDLNKYLIENCQGELCVLAAVDWVKENLEHFIKMSLSTAQAPKPESASQPSQEAFSRLWIYSHHIYNKSKRKNILEWSKELGLSGFSMPGKPGIVCVEGPKSACEEFWSRVKVLTWKKIMIRHREDITLNHHGEDSTPVESIDSLRKFTGFEEAMFDPHGNRGNHMDLGQLYQFLNEKGCCDVFQMYFGIEGR
ncbi:RWD domain-containing protein 2B [Cyprinodon tularosa]|uniref:RWD domain-containing protein 2B n=1 Tax=Cyprinodon variegatus TaxID=28743 RepID=UPI00074299A8|nr:PREDICTED: RWD domain-containing protein 2B [Cyprinodon variegatus]XP_038150331.1 RWD domain-containing protein 2B [Cyprinodon tularosa]